MSSQAKHIWLAIALFVVVAIGGGVAADFHLQHLANACEGIAAFAIIVIFVLALNMEL